MSPVRPAARHLQLPFDGHEGPASVRQGRPVVVIEAKAVTRKGRDVMARALWKGIIEFAAVAVPVKLYTAVRPKEIRFHLLHDQDHVRVRQQMVCPAHGSDEREVPREHVVRGYELRKGQYVVVQEHDLEHCIPEAQRNIRVRRFVDPAAVDAMYYDKPYHLGPDTHGERPYALLARALRESNKMAIVEFVMRGKQYLGAIRVNTSGDAGGGGDALVLETMRYADEIVPTGDVEDAIRKMKVDERQVKMAEQLIETLAADFEPRRYHDEYRACVTEMLEKKARGEKVTIKHAKQRKATKAPDLTEILRASLAQAKTRSKDLEHPSNRKAARA
jgi:DNA end-binding protein Ku